MVYSTGARRTHSMDLRRIVEEVEERKRSELALVGPAPDTQKAPSGGGTAGSLLVAVRERMLAENPEADVAQIDEVLEPDRVEPPELAPLVRGGQPDAARDRFLEQYLEMSLEFEERFGVPGWADFVAKKTASKHPGRKPEGAPKKAPARKRKSSEAKGKRKRPAKGK